MKFEEMPYSRIDMEAVRKDFADLEKRFTEADSGEKQFAPYHDRIDTGGDPA